MDRLLEWSADHRFSLLSQLLIVSASVVLVGVFRALLITALLPWLFFIPVIVMSGLIFGRAASLYASVLSTIVAAVTIGSFSNPLWLTGPQWAGSILFLVVTIGLAWLAGELLAAFRRYRKLVQQHATINAELKQSEEQHILLNHELAHRLKNILSVVQSVVTKPFGKPKTSRPPTSPCLPGWSHLETPPLS
ncbi:HWE histidine kinase domain-containing protein [Agrobacterium cavarae]|uniref:HWE histidine kinase domain-containing protein n=1 Tax=Agrobacterium cavarae TaxID=2528239 RepID=UPI003FD28CA2